MVLEIAQFTVVPGTGEEFRAAYAEAREIIATSPGIGAIRMTAGVESPDRFVLLIEWDSIESHEAFRAGPGFGAWRALIGPFFAGPPDVEHFTDVG